MKEKITRVLNSFVTSRPLKEKKKQFHLSKPGSSKATTIVEVPPYCTMSALAIGITREGEYACVITEKGRVHLLLKGEYAS
jgi:hypothetical protein